jgi:hypothetical protein
VIINKEIQIELVDVFEDSIVVLSKNKLYYLKLDITEEGLQINEVSSKDCSGEENYLKLFQNFLIVSSSD